MGRKRTIDRAATMAAIETVVLRDGVPGLSIDAVAREAGISKSSVVYDFHNKSGLLAAFTRNRMEQHRKQLEKTRAELKGPDTWLKAAIQHSQGTLSEEENAVALMVAAATHASEECHNVMRQEMEQHLKNAQEDSADPRVTLLAFLALHGLKCMEYFNFHRFDADTREMLLRDILALINPDPGANINFQSAD